MHSLHISVLVGLFHCNTYNAFLLFHKDKHIEKGVITMENY